MSRDKKFKDESQDARRHDQHNATHPDDKTGKNKDRSTQDLKKDKRK